jgi:excisionase family DNA binding protein
MRDVRLLKPAEVAELLGVSRAWLYEAARVGRIPSVRLGDERGPLRFLEEDLEVWLNRARAAWSPGAKTAPSGLTYGGPLLAQPRSEGPPRRVQPD